MLCCDESIHMRIVLKSLRTGAFCKGPDDWTNNKADALDFLTSDDAIAFARTHHLKETQVVVQFHDKDYQIHIPYQFDVLAEA